MQFLNTRFTSVVTKTSIAEFVLLRRSLEFASALEHTEWNIRCDRAAADYFAREPGMNCTVFSETISQHLHLANPNFVLLARQKMEAIRDAWQSSGVAQVIYFDSDIVITNDLLRAISAIDADIILAPNYYPQRVREKLIPLHGFFNGGFVFTRLRSFHEWWREATTQSDSAFADQLALNAAPERFACGCLGPEANIGFWRSDRHFGEYQPIPANCLFLHVHFFQGLANYREWLNRSFALHCIRFLRESDSVAHRRLLETILQMDSSHWYRACLSLLDSSCQY